MAWKKTTDELNIVKFDVGSSIEGVLKRRFKVESKKIDPKTKKNLVYDALEFENSAGVLEHIFSSGSLEYKLEDVVIGDKVKITYNGKIESDKSQCGFFHDYSVEKWID